MTLELNNNNKILTNHLSNNKNKTKCDDLYDYLLFL